ncbi:M48 family metallopeptidase [Morganella morganii]|uniref:M48 family metallopeptidase n=1 Tax=Morganella morganii TaxID=582 RepID=UPI0023678A12|nr:M48 family metallopeptidase [Morganella morganii]
MRNKLAGWLLLLPLILTTWGAIQYWRVSDAYQSYQSVMAEKADLQHLIAKNPDTQIIYDDGETVSAGQQLGMINRELNKYSSEITMILARVGISLGTVATGILSLLSGAGAIYLCISSGRAARRSRDTLLKVFARCRKMLPFILTGQMTLVGLSIICVMAYEALWFAGNFAMSGGGAKIMVFILISIVLIIWYIIKGLFKLRKSFTMFRSEPSDVAGHAVSREEAPGLWQWVDEIAAKVGTTPPDHIIAGMMECFYVTSHRIMLNENQLIEGKTLYFPLLYSALLNREEASAVIGHELGHFTGEDTTYSLNFAPIYAGMSHSISLVANEVEDYYSKVIMSPSVYLGIFFLEQFDFAVSHWSRIRELEADNAGASVSSPAAVASSLLRISAVSEVISETLGELYEGTLKTDDLLPVVMARLRERGVPEAGQFLNEATSHPSDSHPQTRARIEALSQDISDELLAAASREVQSDDYANIADLFTDAKALSMMLTASLSGIVTECITQRTEALETLLHESVVADEVVISEGRRTFRVMFIFGLVVVAGMGIAAVKLGAENLISSGAVHGLWLLLLFWGAAFMYRDRGKTPLFAFRHGQLVSDKLVQAYPLHYIVDYDITDVSGVATLTLHVADGAPAPGMAVKSRFFKYDAKKQKLMIMIAGVRIWQGKSLSPQDLSELVHGQLQMAHVKHELRQ